MKSNNKFLHITLFISVIIFLHSFVSVIASSQEFSISISSSSINIDLLIEGTNISILEDGFSNNGTLGNLPIKKIIFRIDRNATVKYVEILKENTFEIKLDAPLIDRTLNNVNEITDESLNRLDSDPGMISPKDLNKSVLLSYQGVYENQKFVTILYNPVKYDPLEEKVTIRDEVHFKLRFVDGNSSFVQQISEEDIYRNSYLKETNITNSLSEVDSIRYLIICPDSCESAFQVLADRKTKAGTPAVVWTLSEISTSYSGDSIQIKIRECIKDFHYNYGLQWVLLGGDITSIPPMYISATRSYDRDILTDQYYACLDGNWNEDGDTLFGEIPFYGDTVDFYPEVYVGRLPTDNPIKVTNYINKLIDYEEGLGDTDYYTKALFLSSYIFSENDGFDWASSVASEITETFEKTYLYQYDDIAGIDSISEGFGLIVNFSHSQYEGNFLSTFVDSPFVRDAIEYSEIDNLTNYHKPSIFLNSTCNNNKLDEENCISRHFINSDSAGGVGYIGSTGQEWPTTMSKVYTKWSDLVYGQGVYEIGKALALAKTSFFPITPWLNNITRMQSFLLLTLGDPQLRVFTEAPSSLDIAAPTWIPWGIPAENKYIGVKSNGEPVSNVLVCVCFGPSIEGYGEQEPTIYWRAYTGPTGVAMFYNKSIPDSIYGPVSIVATHPYYFQAEDSIILVHCGKAGDADDDCAVDVNDPTYIINFIFGAGPAPVPLNHGDVDESCTIDISDAVYLITYIFGGGLSPKRGCVTLPAGGKLSSVSDGPVDNEDLPWELEESEEINVTVLEERKGIKKLQLNTEYDIQALSLTLKTYSDKTVDVTILPGISNNLDIRWHQNGSLLKIGLIDLDGQNVIQSGISDILQINGDFEIEFVIGVHTELNGEIVKTRGTFDNFDNLSDGISFDQNFPNPFNPKTSMNFSIPHSTHVRLEIFNILGQKVKTLANREYSAGRYQINWDGTDDYGKQISSGVYFSVFQAAEFVSKKKMVILK